MADALEPIEARRLQRLQYRSDALSQLKVGMAYNGRRPVFTVDAARELPAVPLTALPNVAVPPTAN